MYFLEVAFVILALASSEVARAQKEDMYRVYDLNKDGKVHPIEVKMVWMGWSNNFVYWSEDKNFLGRISNEFQ